MRVPNASCDWCGERFYQRPSHRTKQKTSCCSRECANKLRSVYSSGIGNHQYGLKGALNSSHKKDYSVSSYGYILVRCLTHPLRNVDDMLFVHRLIIEEDLKVNDPGSEYLIEVDGLQVLSPEFIVHHMDHNKLNNALSNLEVQTLGDHTSYHNAGNVIVRNEDGSFQSVRSKKSSGTLSRAHTFDAGQDVRASESILIRPGDHEVISTGLHIGIAEGYVGLLWSRSGLSANHGLEVGAGCIDSGYTGEVKVNLYNHSFHEYYVTKGERIAQLITLPVHLGCYENVDELRETKRGDKGHGSSGR